ncbi:MAG: polyamine aminopropyltransferase [Synechococcaceae cyanobacterium]|nr:polyamine aminopropyltransferase [Synechococcaceae cyanobacterium]
MSSGLAPLCRSQQRLLLLTAGFSSAVGLVLELLLVTQASYLMGDAALATGLVVGTFLAAMGLGAWLSQGIGLEPDCRPTLLRAFLLVELSLAPLCLLGPLLLLLLWSLEGPVWLALVLLTLAVGVLGGMELPLLTRLLETGGSLRQTLARVLALDYAGALVGSLLFPLLLLPSLGLLPTAGLLSLMPLLAALLVSRSFPDCRRWWRPIALAVPLLAGLSVGMVRLGDRFEDGLYDDPVISRQQSRHQRLVLTRRRDDLRLYLDGNLQFSSLDEYRYHEALVHPVMALHRAPRRVLLLGAGDGLALRELLRWPGLQRVDLVELDPAMLQLARRQPFLRRLNRSSLEDPRLRVHLGDAFAVVPRLQGPFDVVIADFPDPETATLARLYSTVFYGRLRRQLAPDGLLVTQASTPYFAPKVMASIRRTLAVAGFASRGYSVDVPSFGPWGFVLAHRPGRTLQARTLPFRGRWFDRNQLQGLFQLPRDLEPPAGQPVLPNRLSRPVLVEYQQQGRWRDG